MWKRGYPDSVVNTGQQQINRHLALQTSQKEYKIIPFTLTVHQHNRAVKSNALKASDFSKMTQVELFTTGTYFIQTRQKHGNFQVRSARKSENQPGTFKCARARYNTCPFTFTTQVKYLDPSELLKSLIILHALQ